MRGLVIGSAVLVFAQIGAAYAQDSCSDPWEKLPGTYKCEGSCNYTANVCSLPDYTVGIKRWRFVNGDGVSVTGIQVVASSKTIAFATKPGWDFRKVATSDCSTTIKFDDEPNQVVWRKVDDSPSCGGGSRRRRR
jgi:hypothetical protein